jgi:hypothetical protein
MNIHLQSIGLEWQEQGSKLISKTFNQRGAPAGPNMGSHKRQNASGRASGTQPIPSKVAFEATSRFCPHFKWRLSINPVRSSGFYPAKKTKSPANRSRQGFLPIFFPLKVSILLAGRGRCRGVHFYVAGASNFKLNTAVHVAAVGRNEVIG